MVPDKSPACQQEVKNCHATIAFADPTFYRNLHFSSVQADVGLLSAFEVPGYVVYSAWGYELDNAGCSHS